MADEQEQELDLSSLNDEELVQQMHDDLYDGLKQEIEESVHILLDRGWEPYRVLTEALVEGMARSCWPAATFSPIKPSAMAARPMGCSFIPTALRKRSSSGRSSSKSS